MHTHGLTHACKRASRHAGDVQRESTRAQESQLYITGQNVTALERSPRSGPRGSPPPPAAAPPLKPRGTAKAAPGDEPHHAASHTPHPEPLDHRGACGHRRAHVTEHKCRRAAAAAATPCPRARALHGAQRTALQHTTAHTATVQRAQAHAAHVQYASSNTAPGEQATRSNRNNTARHTASSHHRGATTHYHHYGAVSSTHGTQATPARYTTQSTCNGAHAIWETQLETCATLSAPWRTGAPAQPPTHSGGLPNVASTGSVFTNSS